jgi:hypothetical protein
MAELVLVFFWFGSVASAVASGFVTESHKRHNKTGKGGVTSQYLTFSKNEQLSCRSDWKTILLKLCAIPRFSLSWVHRIRFCLGPQVWQIKSNRLLFIGLARMAEQSYSPLKIGSHSRLSLFLFTTAMFTLMDWRMGIFRRLLQVRRFRRRY